METTPRFFICLFANEIFGVKITIFIKKYNFGHKLHRSSVFTSCKTRNMMPDILQKNIQESLHTVCQSKIQIKEPLRKRAVSYITTQPQGIEGKTLV